jgi:hypothetical protein
MAAIGCGFNRTVSDARLEDGTTSRSITVTHTVDGYDIARPAACVAAQGKSAVNRTLRF